MARYHGNPRIEWRDDMLNDIDIHEHEYGLIVRVLLADGNDLNPISVTL